jgi:hypothetical protein
VVIQPSSNEERWAIWLEVAFGAAAAFAAVYTCIMQALDRSPEDARYSILYLILLRLTDCPQAGVVPKGDVITRIRGFPTSLHGKERLEASSAKPSCTHVVNEQAIGSDTRQNQANSPISAG